VLRRNQKSKVDQLAGVFQHDHFVFFNHRHEDVFQFALQSSPSQNRAFIGSRESNASGISQGTEAGIPA
jgi:hypothetical protein